MSALETVMGSGLPRISVIIAAYNCADTLASAIESCLRQTVQNLEVVVVDDASRDGTLDVAQRYVGTGKVRVFSNPANSGPSHSRNRATQEARGDWVAQLDGDDWFPPERLAHLLGIAETAGADAVADDLYLVDNDSLRATSTRFTENGVPWTSQRLVTAADLTRYDLGSVKPIIRRAFLVNHEITYPEDIRYGEDFQFLLRLLLAGGRMLVVPEVGYHLRRGNTGSLTTHRARLFEQVEQATVELLRDGMVLRNADLVAALKVRIRHIRELAIQEKAIHTLKTSGRMAFIHYLLRHPSVAPGFLRRFPAALARRSRRLRIRDALRKSVTPPSVSGMDT